MTNENQKLRNDHISVPVWLAPMLIASFVVLGLGYVVSLSEVTKAGRSSEQNTRLLNRIANKLDVEMD